MPAVALAAVRREASTHLQTAVQRSFDHIPVIADDGNLLLVPIETVQTQVVGAVFLEGFMCPAQAFPTVSSGEDLGIDCSGRLRDRLPDLLLNRVMQAVLD